jgi:flagellar protein FliS
MEKKDYENKAKYFQKASDIINELNIALDLNKGKEIAKNLKQIYVFLERYLTTANIENNTTKIDRAVQILERLKSAFEEILTKPEYQEAQSISNMEQVQNAIKKFA